MIRVLIAEDEELLREGLKAMIEQDEEIEVVGCAGNGREVFELCGASQPDLVLMDLFMPECDGIEGTKMIKEKYAVKVLILTVIYDKEKVSAALNQGADGYALKDIRPEELVQLIKSTINGLCVIHQNVFKRMKNQFDLDTIKAKAKSKEKSSVEIRLTQRERSVVRLIVEGKSNKEIAVSLFLSEGRVRNVITDILKKLKLADRTQLAIFAVRNDII